VELADKGDLTDAQAKEVVEIAKQYCAKLLSQWNHFKQCETIRIIKINKNK
jgi:hypothetical protein